MDARCTCRIIVMVYIVMAHVVMAYIVMAYIVMAYIAMVHIPWSNEYGCTMYLPRLVN